MFIRTKVAANCLSALILASSPAMGAPDLNVASIAKTWAETIPGGNAQFSIKVAGRTPPVNQSIEITGPAEDIRLRLEGGLDFSSIKALSSSLISPGMTDEEKVKACFYFAICHLYNRGGAGCDDPLEYISLWGHSYCGNFGLLLNALWKAAGFQTVFLNPVIGLPSGHAITAVYYDHQWHMFDSRLRGYFLDWDNHTIASLLDLDRDDNLIRRGLDFSNHMNNHWDLFTVMVNYFNAESDWYDGFNAHFDNAKLFNTDCPVWDPRLDLRAGEKLTLRWDNQGKWWNREDLCPQWNKLHSPGENDNWTAPPLLYSNGTLEFRPDLSKLKEQAQASDGILPASGKSNELHPVAVQKAGFVTYRVRVPYFIPSMRLEASAFRATPEDSISADLSTDEGQNWLPLWQATGTGTQKIEASTDQTQQVNWYSPNKYSYLVRINLKAAHSANDVRLTNVRILTDLFYRPHILPALSRGINQLVYSDRSTGNHQRQVVFNWQEDTNILLSEDKPCEGDTVMVSALVKNTGNSPASQVRVRFFDGDPAASGLQIGEDQIIREIAPGETGQAQVKWQAVKRQLNAVDGFSISHNARQAGYMNNTLYVQVDPENKIKEINESNNLAWREVVVYNKANLVLIDPSFIAFDRRGNKVLISGMVRNQNLYGLLPRAREARNVVVRFYDGQPMDGHLDEKLIGESVIPSIAPGEFGVARVEWQTAGLSGRHWVYAVVDPFDQIPEIWQTKPGVYMQIKKEIIF